MAQQVNDAKEMNNKGDSLDLMELGRRVGLLLQVLNENHEVCGKVLVHPPL